MKFTETIKHLMNKDIVYITEDERLADVVFKMSKAGVDLSVVRHNETIVGVISETDIFAALVKEVFSKIPQKIEDLRTKDIVQEPIASQVKTSCETTGWHPCVEIFEDDTIENAIRIMQRSGLHHLLVLDRRNKLVGTLSSHDIIHSFNK